MGRPTPVVEDYLKSVYRLEVEHGAATTGDLANRLGNSAASVSEMLRRMADSALVVRSKKGARLSEEGRREALRVIRRHRVIETFLHQVLGLSVDEVHGEAEVLEHAVSDRLIEVMSAKLGDPSRDPHGDPIPRPGQDHDEAFGPSLGEVDPPATFTVDRVRDVDPGALRHLASLGILPGAVLQVLRRDPFGGPLWVSLGEQEIPLGDVLLPLVHGVPT